MTRVGRLRAQVAALWARWPDWWLAAPALLLLALAVSLTVRAPDGLAEGTTSLPSSGSSAASASTHALTGPQKAAVEATVREYILAHPEMIPEAMTALQNRSVTQLIATNRTEIEAPFEGAWAGAKNGDVTLVEFFDFACPYCRAAKGDIDRLMVADPKLKVVYRDFPVISPASEEPALAALSAARQGRYRAFYEAIFDDPQRVSHEKVVAGVRAARLNEVMTARALASRTDNAELKKNIELGRALGLTGTPAYIVGDRILMGAMSLAELQKAVAEARGRAAVS